MALWAAPSWAAFTDNGDGTVTDTVTGLMWDQCAIGLGGVGCATGTVSNMDWANALKAAVTANTNTYKTYTDWRLPNVKELKSLLKIDAISPAIDATAFPNTPLSAFWTSTSFAPNPAGAWYVNFDSGFSSANFTNVTIYHVRLVRSGQFLAACDLLAPLPNITAQAMTGVTNTAATGTVTVDKTGTGYYLLQPSAQAAPSVAAVLASATTVPITGGTPANIALSGLTPSTGYTLYFVAKGECGPAQSSVATLPFTTLALPPVGAPVPTLAEWALLALMALLGGLGVRQLKPVRRRG